MPTPRHRFLTATTTVIIAASMVGPAAATDRTDRFIHAMDLPSHVTASLRQSDIVLPRTTPPAAINTGRHLAGTLGGKFRYTSKLGSLTVQSSSEASQAVPMESFVWSTRAGHKVATAYHLLGGTAKQVMAATLKPSPSYHQKIKRKGNYLIVTTTPSHKNTWAGFTKKTTVYHVLGTKEIVQTVHYGGSASVPRLMRSNRGIAKRLPTLRSQQNVIYREHAVAMVGWMLVKRANLTCGTGGCDPVTAAGLQHLTSEIRQNATLMDYLTPAVRKVTVGYPGTGTCLTVINNVYPSEPAAHIVFDTVHGYAVTFATGSCPSG